VDPEQMYYLMARGLPRGDAQRLVVEGFFAPVLDRIPLESVREQLRGVIQAKIG
jgi:Fe-S cluster assembly protein SufD